MKQTLEEAVREGAEGYVCALWLDGIAGSLDWFYPDVKCFEKNTRDGKVQN